MYSTFIIRRHNKDCKYNSGTSMLSRDKYRYVTLDRTLTFYRNCDKIKKKNYLINLIYDINWGK